MSTRTYTLPVEQTRWLVSGGSTTVFTWDYDEGRDRLLSLYEKGKRLQWNAVDRIDWTLEPDAYNPLGAPEEYVPIHGSDMYARLNEAERGELHRHLVGWQFSQFLHGEQGALICASKIVQTVPDIDSKFYAATQVMDEARHVEVYSRFLHEKIGIAYPINPNLRALLDDVIRDSRWDMTYLGMQVLIEGLALAAFGLIRDVATDALGRSIVAYVMQDEARHVAFGRLALRELYPQLTTAERAEREEFCVEACHLMRDRFVAEEVWEHLGFDVPEATRYVRESESQRLFRSLLFTRIVPMLRDIGLWGPRINNAFPDMGVLGYATMDLDTLMADDEAQAGAIDAGRASEVADTVALGASAG
ncbi:MAG TPA: ferritin-like domain-containing protein [Candidatus Dormibacteraeota bacterium]|nr:ferritin-like domain-containing protein [Candidatus Dormibacteraeota bacterium]